ACAMNSSLLSEPVEEEVLVAVGTVINTSGELSPPQAESTAPTEMAPARTSKCRTRLIRPGKVAGCLTTGFQLGPRDLNPDYLVQSEACCHYTRAHRSGRSLAPTPAGLRHRCRRRPAGPSPLRRRRRRRRRAASGPRRAPRSARP